MEDWASFQSRVASLKGLETNQSLAEAIAASGFYDNNNGLTCFACNMKVNHKDLGDNPDAVHISSKPDCSFVRQELSERYTTEWEYPKFPEFTTYESRLETFKEWPLTVVSAPQLALAGFFYQENSDMVICHYCDALFKHWVEGDDPLTEHAKGQPDCYFLRVVKGREFVKKFTEHQTTTNTNTSQTTETEQIDTNKDEGYGTEENDECDIDKYDIEKTDTCHVCLIHSQNTLLVPCGHSICCYCSFEITNCCECRADILNRVKPTVISV